MSRGVIKVESFLDRKISRNGKMSATQTIELVKRLEPKLGEETATEKTATELLDYIANQNGDLATKQDVKIADVKKDIADVKIDLENKIELVKIDLENKIENVENKIENVEKKVESVEKKVETGRMESRWLFGLCFGALLTVILYLHSDTKSEVKEIKTDMQDLKTDMQDLKASVERLGASVERLEALIIEGRQ